MDEPDRSEEQKIYQSGQSFQPSPKADVQKNVVVNIRRQNEFVQEGGWT